MKDYKQIQEVIVKTVLKYGKLWGNSGLRYIGSNSPWCKYTIHFTFSPFAKTTPLTSKLCSLQASITLPFIQVAHEHQATLGSFSHW